MTTSTPDHPNEIAPDAREPQPAPALEPPGEVRDVARALGTALGWPDRLAQTVVDGLWHRPQEALAGRTLRQQWVQADDERHAWSITLAEAMRGVVLDERAELRRDPEAIPHQPPAAAHGFGAHASLAHEPALATRVSAEETELREQVRARAHQAVEEALEALSPLELGALASHPNVVAALVLLAGLHGRADGLQHAPASGEDAGSSDAILDGIDQTS